METENTFVLLVKSLLLKGVDNVDTSVLSHTMKEEFKIVGEKFVNNGGYLEAIGTFILAEDSMRVGELGHVCLKKKKPEWAFKAFKYTKDSEGLVDVGKLFLGEERLQDAYTCFKMSGNEEMVKFFEENFSS